MRTTHVGGLAALPLLLWLGAPPAGAAGLLDGKTFVGESGEKGKAKGEAEEIVFQDGTLRSKPCDKYGFGAAPYKATKGEAGISFEAETVSPKEGKIHWKGRINRDNLEGTFVWTKAGQADIEYWAKATLKK
jgi:hypothetical protein